MKLIKPPLQTIYNTTSAIEFARTYICEEHIVQCVESRTDWANFAELALPELEPSQIPIGVSELRRALAWMLPDWYTPKPLLLATLAAAGYCIEGSGRPNCPFDASTEPRVFARLKDAAFIASFAAREILECGMGVRGYRNAIKRQGWIESESELLSWPKVKHLAINDCMPKSKNRR